MIGIGIGALLNVILDPIFIFVFDMGIAGAAIATILSQFVSFCVLLSHFIHGRSTIRLSLKNVRIEKTMYTEIMRSGLPTFFRQSLASAAAIFLNKYAFPYGDAAIAGMSIVTRAVMFISSALIGFGQGFQPVAGFNYGAKQYRRLSEGFWFCVKVGTIALFLMALLGFIFAPRIMCWFRKEDLEVIRIGARAFRLQCLVLPLQPFIVISNMMFQSIGKGREASFLASSRQGLFFIPTIIILSGLLGILGVQLAQPIADVLTFFVAVPMSIHLLRKISTLKDAKLDLETIDVLELSNQGGVEID